MYPELFVLSYLKLLDMNFLCTGTGQVNALVLYTHEFKAVVVQSNIIIFVCLSDFQ